ncbi:MAG: PUR family DNA/RNA-binding protein [Bacteroidales bacterium]|jgi:hypothetical protein|nr:PUR family DNA/RNA-binding protein [Bacteroidales bacterium]
MEFNNKAKEELYSQQISAGKRKYFFDVKATKGGDKFITIAESRKIFDNNTGNFYYEKNKMFLYKEDFEKFKKGLENAFHFIETGEMPLVDVNAEYGHDNEFHHADAPASTGDIDLSGSAILDDMNLKF